MLPVVLLSMLEAPLNRLIALDPFSAQRLQALENKAMAIHIDSLDWRVLFSVTGGRLHFSTEGDAVITLRGRLVDFAQVAMQGGDMSAGTLQITGDVGTAQRWQQFFTQLAPDFDEQLAEWIGDIPAHQIGQLFRQVQQGLAQALAQSQQASVEFLQEEGRWLVPRAELEAFLSEVDELRERAEQLLQQARQAGVR